MRPVAMRSVLVTCGLSLFLLLLLPPSAEAQKDAFLESFFAFYGALAGDVGDGGPKAAAALERMDAALSRWAAWQETTEAQIRTRPGNAADFALFYADNARFADAVAAMASAASTEPSGARFYIVQGLLLKTMGRQTDAAAAFAAAAVAEPSDVLAVYLAAVNPRDDALVENTAAPFLRAVEGGSTRPQIPEFGLIRDSVAPVPAFAPAAYARAFKLFSEGRFHEALSDFRATLAGDPLLIDASRADSAESHRTLGLKYRASGNLSESITQLEAAVQLAPRDERARVALGMTFAQAGKVDEAERVLRETVALLPASGAARWMLSFVYERQGRRREAIATLTDATSLTIIAGRAALYARIALLANRQQDFDVLASALAERVSFLPNDGGAHRDAGVAYAAVGRDDEAVVELGMARLFGVEDAETLTIAGQMHLNAGRLDAAERALRAALAREPQRAQALYALGSTLMRAGNTAEGQQHLDEFKRLRLDVRQSMRRQFAQEPPPLEEPAR